ncbi:N-acetylmuramoyl-L-alanine amidase [Streptomyces adustus]|uniref:N-acetylmuramoyl-L-alanine amidase n=1 Tax=Streptomyces adustus TaxID=1609272 RepID=UPI001390EA40
MRARPGRWRRTLTPRFLGEAGTHLAPSKASGTVDGNDCSYGIEAENLGDGKDTYSRAQYDAWVRINTAICREYGWFAELVACHRKTSVEGKPDPAGPVEGYGTRARFEFTPGQFRKDVAERLTAVEKRVTALEKKGT